MDNKYIFLIKDYNRMGPNNFYYSDGNKLYFPSKKIKPASTGIAMVESIDDHGNYAFIDGHMVVPNWDIDSINKESIAKALSNSKEVKMTSLYGHNLLCVERYIDGIAYDYYYSPIEGNLECVLKGVQYTDNVNIPKDIQHLMVTYQAIKRHRSILYNDASKDITYKLYRSYIMYYCDSGVEYNLSDNDIDSIIIQMERLTNSAHDYYQNNININIYNNGIILYRYGYGPTLSKYNTLFKYKKSSEGGFVVSKDISVYGSDIERILSRYNICMKLDKSYIIDRLMDNGVFNRYTPCIVDEDSPDKKCFIQDMLFRVDSNLNVDDYPSLTCIPAQSRYLGIDTFVLGQDIDDTNIKINDDVIKKAIDISFYMLKREIKKCNVHEKNEKAMDEISRLTKHNLYFD